MSSAFAGMVSMAKASVLPGDKAQVTRKILVRRRWSECAMQRLITFTMLITMKLMGLNAVGIGNSWPSDLIVKL